MKRFLKSWLLYFVGILFLEIIYKICVMETSIDIGLLYTAIFSVLNALFLAIASALIPKNIKTPTMILVMSIITIIFIGEAMFTYIIGSTFSVYSLNLANQALDFKEIVFEVLGEKWMIVSLFLLPLILFIIIRKKILFHRENNMAWCYVLIYPIVYLMAILSLHTDYNGSYSAYNLYYNVHAPSVMVNRLGLLTEFRLDVTRYVTNFESKVINSSKKDNNDTKKNVDPVKPVEYNKLNLTFDANSKIDEYMENRAVTNKNEYTGIFEGKNIIYILAEGFNSIAVDESITPTLYKLVNEGFRFNNYYSPVFMSTTGGEFQFSTSLIPTQKNLNEWKRGNTKISYAIGNVFSELGYDVRSYHDWTYTYYKRNITMPTLGYKNYKACHNGLEKKMNCRMWPPSDVDMMNATIDDYINEDKFAVHYITVSGHAEYKFLENNMADRNRKYVKDLPYSSSIKAYLATQMELDKALKVLLEKLDDAGKLDDTVIVLSGDHYPYTLSVDKINEISTYERDKRFEVNNSNLVIYNRATPSKQIDKLASSVDVLPTILNMFNYDYDSRLPMGSDIMSDHESIVIFNDYSWITEKGRYIAPSNKFIPNDGVEVDDDYVFRINSEVQNRINASDAIISSNYYEKVLKTLAK